MLTDPQFDEEACDGLSRGRYGMDVVSQAWESTQRTQYPLIKEYALNYRGLHIMI